MRVLRNTEPSNRHAEPSSRALLRGCAPISQHLQRRRWAMVFRFSSRLAASQALRRFARSRGKPINQEHLTVSHASSGSSVNLHWA